ncbi:MAG: response regulator, partial [Phycisphaerales bacterium]|nr:response regulator [Phycisphaerales bacterium]
MTTPLNKDNQTRRRVFVVEGDPIVAQHLVAALLTSESKNAELGRIGSIVEFVECTVVQSQGEFFETDPSMWDIVVTASHLHDGTGFDILSFVQGLRPDVPVILTGNPEEADGAVEAIRAGAADYLMLTGHEMITLPVAIQ